MFNPVWKALLFKEWREQRWRFFLSSFVLCVLTAGLLRAQVIPTDQALSLIDWPVGMLLVLFLAIGPIAGERGNRTWEFFTVQPISRKVLLATKWLMGLVQLISIIVLTTLAGVLALWSRGIHIAPRPFDNGWDPSRFSTFNQIDPIIWVCYSGITTVVALASWYTFLFLILIRARDEAMASLMGLLLTVAFHISFGILVNYNLLDLGFLTFRYLAHPLSLFCLRNAVVTGNGILLISLGHCIIWIGFPLLLVRFMKVKTLERWMGI